MSVKDRRKSGKKLHRKTETREVNKTFRIYTEGDATEPEYIDILKRLPQIAESVSIEITVEETGATPMHLVNSACADKRRSNLDIDYYWCVFDVESPAPHPHLAEARQKAHDNDVSLAISNPCFELQPILHHRYFAKYVSTDEAIRKRKELDKSPLKHLDSDVYRPLIDQAIKHAKRLRDKHWKDGTTFPEDNPSSSVDELVALLRKIADSSTETTADRQ